MNTKRMQLAVKDAEKGEVEAIFATFNVIDHDGDVTVPGAFAEGAEVRIGAYGHESWMGALPVGRGTIRVTETDARLVGRFFLETATGREHFETVRAMGELQEWSYGYDAIEWEMGQQDGQRVRYLKRLVVHEVSPVFVGAGIGTRSVLVKALQDRLDGLKQGGFEFQSLIFPKDKWDSAEACQGWAREHDFRADKVDETETSWRLRQRAPGDFVRLRTICLDPSRDAGDECRVLAVGGPLREESAAREDDPMLKELLRFERTRASLARSGG